MSNVKKGKPSWKPAAVTDVTGKEEGYRYRWVNKDPDNLAKKEAEGWETVSKLTSDKVHPVNEPNKSVTSVFEKRDVILQRIPEDIAQERDAYMNDKTQRRTLGLTAHVKKEIGNKAGNAPVHGNITIGSLKNGEQVIE